MSWGYHSDLSDFQFTPNIPHKAPHPFVKYCGTNCLCHGTHSSKFIFPAGQFKTNHINHSCKKFWFKRMGLCHWTHSLKFIFLSARSIKNHRLSLLWELFKSWKAEASSYAIGLTPVFSEFFRGSLKGYHNNQLFLCGQMSVNLSENRLKPSCLSCWTQLLFKI